MADFLLRLWYQLTARVPRLLPSTWSEWADLKYVLIFYFDVPDEAQTWATVAGHVGSVPTKTLRCSYRYLANVALRLSVNKVAQDVRVEAVSELKKKLEEQMKKQGISDAVKEAVASSMREASESNL